MQLELNLNPDPLCNPIVKQGTELEDKVADNLENTIEVEAECLPTLKLEKTQFTVKTNRPVWQQSNIGFEVDYKIYNPVEALILAGANWGVYKEKLGSSLKNVITSEDYIFTDTKLFGVFRDTDNHFLGAIGTEFKLVQNADGFEWFLPFLEYQQAFIESAGTLKTGEIVWIMARLEDQSQLEVIPGDFVEQRLLLTLCHNTRRSPQATLVNTRLNGQCVLSRNIDVGSSANFLKMRQTKSVLTQMARVAEKVQVARRSFQTDVEAYKKLASIQLRPEDTRKVIATIYEKQLAKTIEKEGIETLRYETLEDYKPSRLILDNLQLPELKLPYVENTGWGLYCAFAHYLTYQTQANRRGCDQTKWEAQLEALWFVDKNSVLDKVMQILLSPAGN
jgi:hypothetical protein